METMMTEMLLPELLVRNQFYYSETSGLIALSDFFAKEFSNAGEKFTDFPSVKKLSFDTMIGNFGKKKRRLYILEKTLPPQVLNSSLPLELLFDDPNRKYYSCKDLQK